MGNYYLHNVDDELLREIKIAAATHGRTVREEVIVRLSIAPPSDMLAKPQIKAAEEYVAAVGDSSHVRSCKCTLCKLQKGTK